MSTTTLFDGTLGSLPADQGELILAQILPPPFAPPASEALSDNTVTLNTDFNGDGYTGYVGYTNYTINLAALDPEPINPVFPPLDPSAGFTLSFNLAIDSQASLSDDRPGFTVTVVSSDGQNEIELAFAEDQIFAQTEGFISGEEVDFDTTSPTDYELKIEGSNYMLLADDEEILSGPLRNYNVDSQNQPVLPFNPYELPNFIFLGDNSDLSSATFTLGSLEVETEEDEGPEPLPVDDPVELTAILTGDQEVPQPTNTEATGTASLTLNETGDALSYSLTIAGLDFGEFLGTGPQTPETDDDVTGLHIHNEMRGSGGPVVFGVISPNQDDDDVSLVLNSDGSTTISGIWEETDPSGAPLRNFATAMREAAAGEELDLYWNAHTEEFPSGEIRGQISVASVEEPEPVNPVEVKVIVENLAPEGGTSLTPVWVGFQDGEFDTYDTGAPLTPGGERLAEDGNAMVLSQEFLDSGAGVVDGTVGGGPIAPGDMVMETFTLDSNDESSRFLDYFSMILPSNDAFIANGNPEAHEIFDADGNFIGTEIIVLGNAVNDGGTEVNDELPENTAFFGQMMGNTGETEGGVVTDHPGFNPPGSGGILDDPMFANADFLAEGYEIARITVTLDSPEPPPPIPIDDPVNLTAEFTGDQQVPPVDTMAMGTAQMTLNETGDALSYSITVEGLDFGAYIGDGTPLTPETDDDVTGLHIHNAPRGESGPVVFGVINPNQDDDDVSFMLNSDGSTTISGIGEQTDPANAPLRDLVDVLRGNQPGEELDLYWNIHTEEFPSGEIRGQFQIASEPPPPIPIDDPVNLTAEFTGDQQVPPVDTMAMGTAQMTLNETGDALSYSITVEGLDFGAYIGDGTPLTPETDDDVTGLHIHNAPRGESGPVVFGVINPNQDDDDVSFMLNSDGSTTISGIGEQTDPANAPLRDLVDVLRGNQPGEELDLYWNIHTEEFPSGEIRGQFQIASEPPPPPMNTPPVASNDRANTNIDMPVEINVLRNDRDPDGDRLALSIVTDPSNGNAFIDNKGTPNPNDDDIDYIPDPGFQGTDRFTYEVDDGNGGTDTATVTVRVGTGPNRNPIPGTPEDDNLIGTPLDDDIRGLPGDDVLRGEEGDDLLVGGQNADTLTGGVGNDLLFGGPGNDFLDGGAGDDIISGGLGQDLMLGGDGADIFVLSTNTAAESRFDADVLLIFDVGIDSIGLTEGLTQADLMLEQVGTNTVIKIASNGQTLGLVNRVAVAELEDSFVFL